MRSCDQSTLPLRLVEREQLLVGADREQAIADDERRRVRAGAEAEVLAPRRVLVLPDRLARLRVERDDRSPRPPTAPAAPGRCPSRYIVNSRPSSATIAEWPVPSGRLQSTGGPVSGHLSARPVGFNR